MTGPLGMLIFRDVTLRAQTLEELRKERDFSSKVLDVADMLVVQVREGRIVLFNRKCEEVTGYTAAEVIGRQMADTCCPKAYVTLRENLRRSGPGGSPERNTRSSPGREKRMVRGTMRRFPIRMARARFSWRGWTSPTGDGWNARSSECRKWRRWGPWREALPTISTIS